ncbi:MAG: hypothetical protein CMF80_07135 [Candidatus Marinimicrobia bacterium]|nr:hypothetical protein [Candidatus Neomarinimicrobiota bacterium]
MAEQEVMTVLHEDPQVLVKDEFITKKECEHIIDICKDKLKDALVSNNQKGFVSAGRSGKNCWLQHDHDNITKKIAERIAKIVNIPLSHAEIYQVIYYDETQEYRSHYDGWLHNNSEKSNRCMKYGGQRVATALCYLNDVEEGGCTGFPRLKIEVPPKQGKLLIFENIIKNSGKETGRSERHPLSEHAGRPVIKGKKWAFNLWFRENPKTVLYVPPELPSNDVSSTKDTKNIQDVNTKNESGKTEKIIHQEVVTTCSGLNKETLNQEHKIYTHNGIMNDGDIEKVKKLAKLEKTEKRNSSWIKLTEIPEILLKIVNSTGYNYSFYENANVVQYASSNTHNRFLDAYDFNSENGKRNTQKVGQRLYSIVCFLDDKMTYKFNKLDIIYQPQKGSILSYCNTLNNSNERSLDMYHEISNENENGAMLFNIYVREKNTNGEIFPNHFENENIKLMIDDKATTGEDIIVKDVIPTPPPVPSSAPPPTCKNMEDKKEVCEEPKKLVESKESAEPTEPKERPEYMKELLEVYDKFKDGTITMRGHKSIKFINKIPFSIVTENANKLFATRDEKYGALNPKVFDKEYYIDEFTPLVIDNVYNEAAHSIIKNYFHSNIDAGNFALGDRQAHRYKSNNESFSRLVQYELLPLIEHVVKKPMNPTYIYVSCYTKDEEKPTELPPHTDRPDCEYTISYIIDKPEGSNWPIYVDKTKQPVKNKGRYWFYPPKEGCVAVDANANSLMMFNGTDHIHYREKMECDYYYIVLLHFRSDGYE